MSVVNQMLKDLEDRKAADDGYTAVYQPPEPYKYSKWLLIVLVAAVLVLIAFAVYSLLFANKQSINIPPEPVAIEVQKSPRPMAQVTTKELDTESTYTAQEQQIEPETKVNIEDQQPSLTSSQIVPDSDVEPTLKVPETSVAQDAEPLVPAVFRKSTTEVAPNPQSTSSETASFDKRSPWSKSSGDSLREQALAALRAGQDTLALQLLTTLVQQQPGNIAARKKLAAVLYSQNQSIRATAVLEEGILQHPQDPSLRLMLARLLLQQNENLRALTVITPDVPLSSKSLEFLDFRATLAEQLGVHNVAFGDYLQLSIEQPKEAKWWLGIAVSGERTEQYSAALQAYQQVVALDQLGDDVQSFAQQRINQLVRIP